MLQPIINTQNLNDRSEEEILNGINSDIQIEEILNSLNLEQSELFREIAALLSLPDDKFEVLAPITLESIQKNFDEPTVQMNLCMAFNLSNIKLEDLEEISTAFVENLEKSNLYSFSEIKISFIKQVFGTILNSLAASQGVARRVIKVPIEKCHEDAKAPVYAHVTDSGMDVYALEDITINPGETKLIPIGIKVAIPRGYELQVRPKSGRSLNSKLRIANTPGTIDAGYRDEIGIIVENIEPVISDISYEYDDEGNLKITSIDFGSSHTIGAGEKFAQLVLAEVPKVSWLQVDSVTGIGEDRGGGFGSTGLK